MNKRDVNVLMSMIKYHENNNTNCSDDLKVLLHDIHLQVLNIFHDERQYMHHEPTQLFEKDIINREDILEVVATMAHHKH